MSGIEPFNIAISDDVLSDLQDRLRLARFPQNVELSPEDEWKYGTPTNRVKELVEYWRNSLDWRKIERNINLSLPQFTTKVDAGAPHGELEVHFVHKRSPNPKAIPLIFVHGWPGNFLEVTKIIEPLTNPTDPKDPAFHVVAPSLPGYIFSEGSRYPGLGIKTTALMFDGLMRKIGYNNYIAQGGDWGSMVIKALAVYHGDTCRGTHSNMPLASPSFLKTPLKIIRTMLGFLGLPGGYPAHEVAKVKHIQASYATPFSETMGYMRIQSTKPQTLAYGMTDSPTGLLAWIYEKLFSWTDSYPWTPEEIITWVMLYWVSTAGPVGGFRYYREAGLSSPNGEVGTIVGTWSSVPLGVSVFPKELLRLPTDWLNMSQPLKYHKEHPRGGHFAAYETPNFLVDDIRRFAEIIIPEDPKLMQYWKQ